MFWGQNIKSGESFSFDSDKSMIGKILDITNISLSDAIENTKYFLKFTNNNQTYQLCSLDKKKDSITSSLAFKIQEGMKLSVKGGNKGMVSIVGFIETFKLGRVKEIENENENMDEEKSINKMNEKKNEK